MMKFILISLLIICLGYCSNGKLEVKSEKDLQTLFNEEKHIIILFSGAEDCVDECKQYEEALLSIREEFVEATSGWVVRSYAPAIAESFGVKKSSILFMREGSPLLYPRDASDEEHLLAYLINNKIPLSRNLTDANFEHETQAATGATTGDWFVMFTKPNDLLCQQLMPTLEAVAVNLKGSKNVAFLDREMGAVTARRFGVKTFPYFILFRQGHLFRYSLSMYDTMSLSAFASDNFRNSKGELVPTPKAPFDDLTEATVDWLKENPTTFMLCAAAVVAFLAIVILLNRPVPKSWAKKKSKKKN